MRRTRLILRMNYAQTPFQAEVKVKLIQFLSGAALCASDARQRWKSDDWLRGQSVWNISEAPLFSITSKVVPVSTFNPLNAKKTCIWKCHLFMSSDEYSCKLFILAIFAYMQTVWTQIRLLLEELSEMGPHCLQKWLLKSQADDKVDDNCCDWQFKG